MKKSNTFLSVVIIVVITLQVFSVSAQDVWTTGGNNADSTDFIGTINTEPLKIKTDSIDRIIISVNDSIQFKGMASPPFAQVFCAAWAGMLTWAFILAEDFRLHAAMAEKAI